MSDEITGAYSIGPYAVVRHLAQGGMASIYRVLCPDTGVHQAMKLAGTTDAKVARFHQIHDCLIRLDHPNLIPVQSFGETEDKRPYIIFDIFEGLPAQVCARAAGKPGSEVRTTAVTTMGIQLAEALDYLHTHDIIHRDVKSANVLVAKDYAIRLIDFGSALLPGDDRNEHNVFVGTYTYAPPEQILGKPADGRADIYAMGVLLYRLYSGIRPFHSEDLEELKRMHFEEQAAPLTERHTDLPASVSDLVEQMMAKDPNMRPARAKDVADALRES